MQNRSKNNEKISLSIIFRIRYSQKAYKERLNYLSEAYFLIRLIIFFVSSSNPGFSSNANMFFLYASTPG